MIDITKLKQNFAGELDTSSETRKRFSRDASIFEVTPELVAAPASVEDVKQLVQYATEQQKEGQKTSLTPRAGGTDMTGSSIGSSIVVDFAAHLNTIGPVEDNTIHVQPGAYFRDLEKITKDQQLMMPAYPVSKMICGVGGMIGNNAGGEKSHSYGQVRDYILELKAVFADGNEYLIRPLNAAELETKIKQNDFEGGVYLHTLQLIKKNEQLIRASKPSTSKNSSGYYLWDVWDGHTFDLTKLLVGSQGTLGIITEAKFKLVPIKKHSELLVIFMKNLDNLGNIIGAVKQHKPESFELFDDHTLSLAMQYLPEMMEKMGGKSIKLLWQFLPELWMAFVGGRPKLVLLAEFTGDSEEEVYAHLNKARDEVAANYAVKTHVTKNFAETQKYWTIRRESYNLLRTHTKGKISACFIEDICVHPEELPQFLPKLNAIFKRYPGFIYTIAGHAGDANFHIMPLMDLNNENERTVVTRMSNEVYDLVKEYKGTISAEHNDGLVRGPFLHKMFSPEILEVFKQVKRIFDPLDIFNPGRKIEASMKDFNAYMRRS